MELKWGDVLLIRGLKLIILAGMILTLLFLIVSMITGFAESVRHDITQYSIIIFAISYAVLDIFSEKREDETVG